MSGPLANVVWPALYLMNREITPELIAFSLVLEAWLLQRWLCRFPRHAMLLSVTANAVSLVPGCFLLPLWGWHWDLASTSPTFSLSKWAATCVFSWLTSSLLEGVWIALWIGWHRALLRTVLTSNFLTVSLAYLSFFWWDPRHQDWLPQAAWNFMWW